MSEEVKQEGDFKVAPKKKRGRPKKLATPTENTTVVDFKKQEEQAIEEKQKQVEDAVSESESMLVDANKQTGNVEAMDVGATGDRVQPDQKEKEDEVDSGPTIEEITPTETKEIKKPDIPVETPVATKPEVVIPEGIEKLMNFMQETGGTIEDYARLNIDYSKLNNEQLLREYYKSTKPYLSQDEITFHMEEQFAWDEDENTEKEITHKKIVLKEELAKAEKFLKDTKDKYYEEIKLNSTTTADQQEALDFYKQYNEGQDIARKRHEVFKQSTYDFFNKKFEGFEFNVGEKSFRYNVKNPNDVADKQSDLNSIIGKFLNENGDITDYQAYHKAMYAARNPDLLAKHFYEQGRADSIKQVTAQSNNITHEGREASGDVTFNGYKVRAISGDNSSKLKIKKWK